MMFQIVFRQPLTASASATADAVTADAATAASAAPAAAAAATAPDCYCYCYCYRRLQNRRLPEKRDQQQTNGRLPKQSKTEEEPLKQTQRRVRSYPAYVFNTRFVSGTRSLCDQVWRQTPEHMFSKWVFILQMPVLMLVLLLTVVSPLGQSPGTA